MRSTLLFRLGGLGDLLAALPSANLLRRAFPGASIHLAGRRAYGELLRESGVVDSVFSADDAAWMPFFSGAEGLPDDARARIAGYDFVLGLFHQAGPAPILAERQRPAAAVRVIRYEAASGLTVSRFFFDRTAALVRAFGAEPAPFEACALLPLPAGTAASRRSDSAVIHPGSGSPKKRWPLERFLEVMRALQRRGLTGVLVTGEAEELMEPDLRHFVFPPGWRWLPRPSVSDLARLLRTSGLYLGNDSGVTHLAAACGASVVALFRTEFVSAWSPFGRAIVLSARDAADIPVPDVTNALASLS